MRRARTDLAAARTLVAGDYQPRGGTLLLDAIGETLEAMDEDWRKASPYGAVVVIVTDGHENASRTFTKGKIRQMIETREATGQWSFMYLGANVDAFDEAGALGISDRNTAGYRNSSSGIRCAYENVSDSLRAKRMALTAQQFAAASTLGRNLGEGPEEEVLSLTLVHGVAVAQAGSRSWIIDTGSPSSFGRVSSIRLAGSTFRLPEHLAGRVAIDDVLAQRQWPRSFRIDGLLGADVLGCFDAVFDLPAGSLTLATGRLRCAGATVPCDAVLGIPVVPVTIDGAGTRFFVDTGAQYSYVRDDRAPAGRRIDPAGGGLPARGRSIQHNPVRGRHRRGPQQLHPARRDAVQPAWRACRLDPRFGHRRDPRKPDAPGSSRCVLSPAPGTRLRRA